MNHDRIDNTPSVYVFIFANPLSGDEKGRDLTELHVQNFRLKEIPEVQMQVYNVLDDEDRERGFATLKAVEHIIEEGATVPESDQIGDAAKTRQIHVWSAGGDGTVMSVFEELVKHKVDMSKVYFSCIPFGTGNDFSQVLGWGRTIANKDVLGDRLSELASISKDRLNGVEARLDIWELEITCYDKGYVRKAGRSHRHETNERVMVRKFSNYLSLGVQGWVGSGFENQRTGTRKWNALVYVYESFKWMFFKGFPPITRVLEGASVGGKRVLNCSAPVEKGIKIGRRRKSTAVNKVEMEKPKEGRNENGQAQVRAEEVDDAEIPTLQKHPIDLVIQNIPHIWGREIDLWGEAVSGEEVVQPRSGPTDPETWTPQRANDGRLEVFCITNMISYLKKLASFRDHVSRIGQFEDEFQLDFRCVEHTPGSKFARPHRTNKFDPKDPSTMCIMCDGEFYEVKDLKTLKFRRFAQITTLGRDPESSRLVTDEQQAKRANQPRMNRNSN